jgi:hypothetical protein
MGAQQSLSVNKRRQLEYPTASYSKEDIMSTPDIVGHKSMTFHNAWASVWWIIVLGKLKVFKKHEQQSGM